MGTKRTRAGEACYLGWQIRVSHRPGAGEALNEDLPELLGTEASGGDQPAALSKLTSLIVGMAWHRGRESARLGSSSGLARARVPAGPSSPHGHFGLQAHPSFAEHCSGI